MAVDSHSVDFVNRNTRDVHELVALRPLVDSRLVREVFVVELIVVAGVRGPHNIAVEVEQLAVIHIRINRTLDSPRGSSTVRGSVPDGRIFTHEDTVTVQVSVLVAEVALRVDVNNITEFVVRTVIELESHCRVATKGSQSAVLVLAPVSVNGGDRFCSHYLPSLSSL